MCLYPKLLKNKKYIANKKNGGNVPPVIDNRTLYVTASCGKCIECLRQKGREWQVRLYEEIKEHKNGKFVTLSFSEEAIYKLEKKVIKGDMYQTDNNIATLAVRQFLEKWRWKHKKSVRHWLVTELGQINTERIHLHGIIFTDNTQDIKNLWTYGNVWIGEYVNSRTINYITKYITKTDILHKDYKPKILTSKGIGRNYITNNRNSERNKYNGKATREYYLTETGHKISLPIYYRNHIYNNDEKEQLWINKIDKGEIYVMGEKININDIENEKEYHELLEYYRKKNERLGYGTDKKNFDERMYKLRLSQQRYREKRFKNKE